MIAFLFKHCQNRKSTPSCLLWSVLQANDGIAMTKEALWRYFVTKCRRNLHIVFAMSPVGETLRTRCRNFPGMVNNCVIDWFDAWPSRCDVSHHLSALCSMKPTETHISHVMHSERSALRSVAENFLNKKDVELPESSKQPVVQHMVSVHLSVRSYSERFLEQLHRHNHVTPKSYLDFIGLYKKLLRSQRQYIGEQSNRLSGTLSYLQLIW